MAVFVKEQEPGPVTPLNISSEQAASEDQSHDNDKRPEQESEFVDQLDVSSDSDADHPEVRCIPTFACSRVLQA